MTPYGAYAKGVRPGGSNAPEVFDMLERYDHGCRAGHLHVLLPSGANCPLSAGGGAERLLPGRTVFAPRPAPLRRPPSDAAVAALPQACRSIAEAWAVAGPAGPEARQDDGCDCVGTYECALVDKITLDYADVELCFDEDWFFDTHASGGWMSPGAVVNTLWAAARGHGTGISRAQFSALVDCWMIDPSLSAARGGRSYRMFFSDDGGPVAYLHQACDLVRRFREQIVDDYSGVPTCDGLEAFIVRLLDGGQQASREANYGPCALHLRAVSLGSEVTPRAVTTCEARKATLCHDFEENGRDPGGSFDDWSALYYHQVGGSRDSYLWRVPNPPFAAPTTEPATSTFLGLADPEAFAVYLPANRVAFRGFVADWTMFWARAALQRAMQLRSFGLLEKSWLLARTVLADMMDTGRLLVHEIGHLYMGVGGHCRDEGCAALPCECCFDIAAEHWKCKVAAHLGVPSSSYYLCLTDPVLWTSAYTCSVGGTYPVVCDPTPAPCTAGGEAIFWAGPCTGNS